MSLTRRELLAGMGVVSLNAVLPVPSSAKSLTSDLRINPDRLRESLEGLSLYGRPPGGSFADGVSRVAFSDADIAGRNYVMRRMREFDLEPRVDPAGNIFWGASWIAAELETNRFRLTHRLGTERWEFRWRSGLDVSN